MKKPAHHLYFVFIVLLCASLACGRSTSSRLSDAAQQSTADAGQATSIPGDTSGGDQEQPTPPPAPTQPQPTLVADDLVVEDQIGVFQDSTVATAIFLVDNPNETLAVDDSPYQVTFYDQEGTILSTETGVIAAIFPQEKLAVSVDSYLSDGQEAVKAEVQLSSGESSSVKITGSPFQVENALFIPDEYIPRISGVIQNSLSVDLTDVKLTAVAYDETGTMIGGGHTYLNFLPAQDQTGADVSVVMTGGKPASIELYPTVSTISDIESQGEIDQILQVGEQGFGQDGSSLGVAYFVTNQDADQAIENSLYRIAAYDAGGNVLGTNTGYLPIVLPGERLGNYADIYLPEGEQVDHVSVQVKAGSPKAADLSEAPFTIDQIEYQPDDYSPKVTGILHNGLNRDITDLRINAIAYDADGNIVGGGYSYIDFLPASSQAAVEVSGLVNSSADHWEVYPTLTSLSFFDEQDSGGTALQLIDQGFGQDGNSVGVAFLVQNTGTDAMEYAQYQVAAYDEGGSVLDTDSGYFNVIFAGETTAECATLYLGDGKKVDHVDIQVKQGDPTSQTLDATPFTSDTVQFIPDNFLPKVTGLLYSSLDQDVNNVEVVAVAYNEAGEIIGGGSSYIDFIPAAGKSAAEVYVTVSGEPARVDLYPSLTSMSDLE